MQASTNIVPGCWHGAELEPGTFHKSQPSPDLTSQSHRYDDDYDWHAAPQRNDPSPLSPGGSSPASSQVDDDGPISGEFQPGDCT
jgi:hypothetical protein